MRTALDVLVSMCVLIAVIVFGIAALALATSPITMIVVVSSGVLAWWWILVSIPACMVGVVACVAIGFILSFRDWSWQ